MKGVNNLPKVASLNSLLKLRLWYVHFVQYIGQNHTYNKFNYRKFNLSGLVICRWFPLRLPVICHRYAQIHCVSSSSVKSKVLFGQGKKFGGSKIIALVTYYIVHQSIAKVTTFLYWSLHKKEYKYTPGNMVPHDICIDIIFAIMWE